MKDNAPPAGHPTAIPTPSNGPPEAVGFEASWERFRAEALGLDPRDVKTFPYNASVVLHNVQAGVDVVLAERPWFERQPDAPRVDFARVADTTAAAEALVFVASQAAGVARATPVVRAKIVRARVVVRALKAGATALVEVGVLQTEELPRGAGRGPLATARDCLAYASLFRAKHARTRGATGVKSELVREAAALGSELLHELRPKGALERAARSEPERAAADARDRMAVVLTRRYAYVEQAAGWRWGRGLDAFVPAMLSRDTARGASTDDEDTAADEDLDEDTAAEEDDVDARDEAGDEGDDDEVVAGDDEGDDDEAEPTAVVTSTKPGPKRAVAAKPTKPAKHAVRGR